MGHMCACAVAGVYCRDMHDLETTTLDFQKIKNVVLIGEFQAEFHKPFLFWDNSFEVYRYSTLTVNLLRANK